MRDARRERDTNHVPASLDLMLKKLLIGLLVVSVLGGGYYMLRLLPLITLDNTGAAKVVLLHGLGRTPTAMLLLESALTEAGFDVYSLSYSSTDRQITLMLDEVTAQIDLCCSNGRETVHFVGHSLGGLLIRAYLQSHHPPSLGRVVLLGTPNRGSELADPATLRLLPKALLDLVGPE